MKKIVHMTSVHPPFDVRIFVKECRSLREAGFDVHLVAPHTRDEVVDGVSVWAVPPEKRRLRRMWQTARAVYRRARSLEADLYHFHDPELLPWGLMLRLRTGAAVVYDSHEYVALDVRDKDWMSRPVARAVAAVADVVEKFIARRLSGVVAVNEHMAGLFRRVTDNVAVVANYPSRSLAQTEDVAPEQDTVVYVGMMAGIRGFDTMTAAMPMVRARRPQAVCRLLGDIYTPGMPAQLASLSRADLLERGIETVTKVKYDEVGSFIARHSVGWLPWKWCASNLYGTPTKLFEYMALGRPVVASNLPFVKSIVEDANCGIVAQWDSPAAHAEAILRLLENGDEARRLGENGRRAVEERFNWEVQADSLVALYARLLETSAVPDDTPLARRGEQG